MKRLGRETRDLHEAINDIKTGDLGDDFDTMHHFDYIGRSKYRVQLARLHQNFPLQNIFIFTFERLIKDTDVVMSSMASFLDMPLPDTFQLNKFNTGSNKTEIETVLLNEINKILEEDITLWQILNDSTSYSIPI